MTDDPFVKFLVAFLFVASNCVWAYAQVITKQLQGVNSIQINIHLALAFLFTTGLVYPTQVETSVSI
jgi:glutathionyl-hydroquinone reductase